MVIHPESIALRTSEISFSENKKLTFNPINIATNNLTKISYIIKVATGYIEDEFVNTIALTESSNSFILIDNYSLNKDNKIEVEYAYQDVSMVPSDVVIPQGRIKPWGTTHAILCAKDKIDGDFAIINADDFYGKDAYIKAAEFFDTSNRENEYAVISYPFKVTSSSFGSVKRAVLNIKDGYILDLTESKITLEGEKALCEPLNGNESFYIDCNHPVSMNLFCFKENFLNYIEEDFSDFTHQDEILISNGESLIPDTVKKYLNKNQIILKNITTTGIWSGVTYKEDLPNLKETINTLINNGEYSDDLWK